jgi:hypothetical protein
MAEQNSISTLLPELLRLFNNSVESFEKVNQAITSNRDSVTVDLQNNDGTISRVTIPSFGFLKNSVDRLDRNIQTITNINGGDSSIRLSDGTFRKLVLSNLPTEAKDLTSINSVNTFNIKPNWFFEELINPLLYVAFNITGQAPINTERAIVRRFILDTNTKSKINIFENNYKGRSDISYDSFIQDLVEKNISYVLDEAVVDLPPREKRYSGNFSVIRISEADVTQEINGVSVTTQKKLYKLNKLTYSDNETDFSDTLQLKVGDSLEVVSDSIDTRYRVVQVDTSTNSVVLELVEGSRPISIGSDVLKIGSNLNGQLEVDVTVGFNERCVVFIKPIDPNSKIPAVNFSPGSAFYTNDLVTVNESGTEQTLSQFYQENAVDFGKILLSFAQDKFPTSKEGIKPNAPQLTESDFNVVEINKQVTQSEVVVQLEDLNNQKNVNEARLTELDDAIAKKRTKIQTTNYTTEVERDADRNELQGLITERSSQAELYSSVVKEIASKGDDNSASTISPKYRVRGFWKMPTEKIAESTGVQSIIKFKIRYRYLSADGAANPVDQFNFQDGITESQGAFSNYIEVESILRSRNKNPITGSYEWDLVNNDNADEININQLDIPIRKGEIVEFQVKSVSEAGWPSNPLESDWSNEVRIEFPANLSSESPVEQILQQNKEDLAKVNLEKDLDGKGINEHLSTQFTANETFFAHTANSIASGFLSAEQNPINLFAKLTEMQNRLDQFEEILRVAKGELAITLVDDEGNNIKINRNAITKVFAGFYSEEVLDLDDPRGAIVSKTFFLNVANSNQTTLQLISSIGGSRTRMVTQSENPSFTQADAIGGSVILPATYPWLDNSASNQSDGLSTYNSNNSDYNTIRKYDLTPITLTNPDVIVGEQFGQIKSLPPFQSSQNKNQFINSRFKDVSSDSSFYGYINPDGEYIINLDTAENVYGRTAGSTLSTPGEFIWGGGFDSSGNPTTSPGYQGSNDDTIELHIEHPSVQSYAAYENTYKTFTGDTSGLTLPGTVGSGVDCTSSGNSTSYMLFRHSKFAPLKSDDAKGKQQSIYLNEDYLQLNSLAGTGNYPSTLNSPAGTQSLSGSDTISNVLNGTFTNFSRNVKNSFDTFDQYLIGKKSCGSYLFMASDNHEFIQVSGDAINSTKSIGFGSQNSINIPIVFQYRMTDYFGSGSGANGGIGNIAGDSTGATINVTYIKRIGIDIYPNGEDVVQFDLEFFAKYKSDNLNIKVFPSATVSKGLNDLEKVISKLNPTITETQVNQNVRGNRLTGFLRANQNSSGG